MYLKESTLSESNFISYKLQVLDATHKDQAISTQFEGHWAGLVKTAHTVELGSYTSPFAAESFSLTCMHKHAVIHEDRRSRMKER